MPAPHGQGAAEEVAPAGPEAISYMTSARTRAGRAAIRAIENLTGRLRIIRLAEDYQADIAQGKDFWEVMCSRYRVRLDLPGAGLANIPREGPLVCVANHPYGILDGLTFGHIMKETRKDFRILANSVFVRAPEIERYILPIDFGETREAVKTNLRTRKMALEYLAQGGCIGIFPGGAVSTSKKFYTKPFDPQWKTFTAKLVQQSNAQVVPMFYDGRNSRLFQVASHLSDTLRLSLLLSEFESRIDTPVRVVIGAPLPQGVISGYKGDPRGLMAFLREHTYSLSPRPIRRTEIGKEW